MNRPRLDTGNGIVNIDLRIFAVEYRRRFTTSGIERTVTVWKFARWSHSFTTWRAG